MRGRAIYEACHAALPGHPSKTLPFLRATGEGPRPAPLPTAQGGRKLALRSWSTADRHPLHPVKAVPGGGTKPQRKTFAPCLGVLGGRKVP